MPFIACDRWRGPPFSQGFCLLSIERKNRPAPCRFQVSSAGSDFNADFKVTISDEELATGTAVYNYEKSTSAGEQPGLSVFYRNDAGEIFHTYSTYARGLDLLVGAYNYLDLTPKGRNEDEIMEWVRYHDRYEDEPAAKGTSSCCSE